MPVRISTEREAKAIAAYTVDALRRLREAPTPSDAKRQADEWFAWADSNHVCSAIRSHFSSATTETIARLKGDQ